MDVYSALEIDCRLAADGEKLHAIIGRASSRLSAAFPSEVPEDPVDADDPHPS